MGTRLKGRFSLLLLAFGVMIAIAAVAMGFAVRADAQAAPTIQSDKGDYAPGELVTLTGSGWQPGESVHINVNDTYGATWSRNVDVTADASGNITDSFNLPPSFVSDYDVTATGAQSGTVRTTFTDGNAASVSGKVTDSATTAGLSGVTVTCTSGCNNNPTASTTTDASGNYKFDGSPGSGPKLSFPGNGPATLTLTFSKSGYTNGTITLTVQTNGDSLSNQNIALVPATKKLTVTKTGAGTGTVTSSPAGINCGATCSANFNNGQSVTLTATQGANSTFNGWSGGSGTLNNDGTYTVTMDADKSVAATFKANQAALNYTGPTNGTFGDKLTLSSSGGSGTGAVTYEATGTACNIPTSGADAGKLVITSGTGTCLVEVKKAGDNDYNAATSGPQTITVSKANQAALTVDDPDEGTFGDHLPIVTSGGNGTGALSFDTDTSTACQIDANNKLEITSGTGTCSVKATKAGNDNYNPVTSDAHSVTVHKAAPTITWNNPSAITYGTALSGTQLNATAKGVDNNNLAGSFSYSPAASTVLSATGSPHTLSTTFTPTNTADYTNANAQVSLTVNKADLTVTADNKSKVYGDPNPPLTGTLTGVVNGDNITANYTTTATQFSLAGTYPIVPQLNDPGNRLGNYNVTKNNGTLTVGALSPKGFYQPIDMSTAQTTVYNSVKGGSTVPVKFELFKVANDPSTELRDTSYVNKFTATKLPTCTAGTEDAIEETVATGQTTLRFDTTGDQFIYNWATPKVSSTTCYKLTMLAADGTTQINAYFTLRK